MTVVDSFASGRPPHRLVPIGNTALSGLNSYDGGSMAPRAMSATAPSQQVSCRNQWNEAMRSVGAVDSPVFAARRVSGAIRVHHFAFRAISTSVLSPVFQAVLLCAVSSATSAEQAAEQAPERLDYSRDIRPILSQNCFACHGPDEDAREADLRLDRAAEALADRGGVRALVPGDPEASLVLQRLVSKDDSERMPPAGSNKSVTPDQIDQIRRWISDGAQYSQHWSLVPPTYPSLPEVSDSQWPRNAVDRFVLARLEREGLKPSAPADRYALVRRVYLDLLGLPPSPQQADAFVNDQREDAYERLVERLLASPRYGERWARRWLDLARYSDTNGYEKDRPRTMWPYRDWVIDALNEDMPFDQFTVEQVAGDMLPEATQRQRIATGFHRNTMINEEGGIDPLEFRFLAVVDRLGTTGTTWLGLTVGCAQCHTHKYDPISQEEYYQLFALLNNANEPTLEVPLPDGVEQQTRIETRIADLEAKLAEHFPAAEASDDADARRQLLESRFEAWCQQTTDAATVWQPLTPQEVQTEAASVDILPDGSVLVSGDQTKNDIFTLVFPSAPRTITAIRLEALPHDSLPERGPGRRLAGQGASAGVGDFFLSRIGLTAVDAQGQQRAAPFAEASATFAAQDRDARFAIDDQGDTGWSIAGRPGERHVAVFNLATPLTIQEQEQLEIRLEHESFYPSGLGRFRIAVTSDTRPARATLLPDEILTMLRSHDVRRRETRQALLRHYLAEAPELAAQHQQIAELRKQIPAHPTALVMQERPDRHRRTTRVHHRGEFLQAKQAVEPNVPVALHPLPAGAPRNRLALARWLVARDNPLVARVVVNRHWQALFGQGLVRTTEDFGMQGKTPTHPLLLDWLAVQFMDSGWSLKELHRTIVSSATYRQTSAITGRLMEQDPENRLLARGPRMRVDAELIRDIVLSASGQLSNKMGGPSVFPPQPAGISENSYGPLSWEVSEGEDRYRRGLFTFSKRTAPYATFGLFDAPSGEACLPRRVNSNTPLQALDMLNDPVVVEAAQMLARRVIKLDGDERRAEFLFRACLTRPPHDDELQAITTFFQHEYRRFESGQANPHLVAGGGDLRSWSFDDEGEGWAARHQCNAEAKDGRLQILSSGNDPFVGSTVTAPAGQYLLSLRARSETGGEGQVFWQTESQPVEAAERSASFTLVPNQWRTYRVPLDFTSNLTALRFDPGAAPGLTEIDWMRISYGHTPIHVPAGADMNGLAGWTLVARALLNLDETITKP